MRELCACINNDNQNVTPLETIDAIAEAGFKVAFIQWYDKQLPISQQQQLDYARKKGLRINFAHLGYQNLKEIWNDNEIGEAEVERYIVDLKACKENGIDTVIMHLHGKKDELDYGPIGYQRLERILKEAEELEVNIAFENTKSRLAMDCSFENVKSERMFYCHDVGHCHAYQDDYMDFEKYKGILEVHIHDNHGQGLDEHLLPFDGTIDWENRIEDMVKAGYKDEISLELCYRNEYLKQYTLKEFYREAYQRGLKLAEIFGKYDLMYSDKQ